MSDNSVISTYMFLLKTNSGRDKVLRTLGYASVFISGGVQGKLKKDLQTIATHFGATRTVLRLFDDIPMILLTLRNLKSKVISNHCVCDKKWSNFMLFSLSSGTRQNH